MLFRFGIAAADHGSASMGAGSAVVAFDQAGGSVEIGIGNRTAENIQFVCGAVAVIINAVTAISVSPQCVS